MMGFPFLVVAGLSKKGAVSMMSPSRYITWWSFSVIFNSKTGWTLGYTQFHQTSVSRIYSPLLDFLEKTNTWLLGSYELLGLTAGKLVATFLPHTMPRGSSWAITWLGFWSQNMRILIGRIWNVYIYIYIYNDTVGEEIIRIRMGVDSCLNKPSILSEVESST